MRNCGIGKENYVTYKKVRIHHHWSRQKKYKKQKQSQRRGRNDRTSRTKTIAETYTKKKRNAGHTILHKNRPKHAYMNINEIYVVDDWDNLNEEQLEVITDEEELLAYKHQAFTDGYTNPKTYNRIRKHNARHTERNTKTYAHSKQNGRTSNTGTNQNRNQKTIRK